MDALISAQAGTALFIDGANLTSIHANAPELAIPRRTEEVHLLFGEGFDLQVLEGVTRDQVARRLVREADSAEALQLSLILLDSELPEDIRSEAAEELDGLLAEKECREDLERILFAHPFPSDADASGALTHSEGRTPRVQDLLRQLVDLQPVIAEVRRAWAILPDTLFANSAERQRFQTALVREGLFRELVLVRQAGISVESFLDTVLLHPAFRKIQGYEVAMTAWAAPFLRFERVASITVQSSNRRTGYGMSAEQQKQCHVIIHGASSAAAAVGSGLTQLPMSNHPSLGPIQIGMIIALGKIFGVEITIATAKSLALGMAGMYRGRYLPQVLFGWIPILGNALNATTAAGLTEAMGWAVARHLSRGEILSG